MRGVSKRSGVSCDVKDSSYVWLRNFLDALEEDGFLKLKPLQKDPMVIWINRDHCDQVRKGHITNGIQSAVVNGLQTAVVNESKSNDTSKATAQEHISEDVSDSTEKFQDIIEDATHSMEDSEEFQDISEDATQ